MWLVGRELQWLSAGPRESPGCCVRIGTHWVQRTLWADPQGIAADGVRLVQQPNGYTMASEAPAKPNTLAGSEIRALPGRSTLLRAVP